MKLCQSHWSELKAAIEVRGLMPFVAKNGKEVVKEMINQIKIGEDYDKIKPYDPLMSANMAIWEQGIKCGGLYLMQGELCPLCELEKNSTAKASDWINPCCDEILEDFKSKGWLSLQN
jgi:hypothetical protein